MVRKAGTTPTTVAYVIELEPVPVRDQVADYEIQRTIDDGFGSPHLGKIRDMATLTGMNPRFIDRLANDGTVWHYRCRAVKDGWTASSYTDWVSTSAVPINEENPEIWEVQHVAAGAPIVSDTTGADRLLVTAPQIASDSAGDFDLEDGDSITFSGFDSPPNWWAQPTGLVWETTLVDGSTTNRAVRLENVTSSGADVVAELQQPSGSATNRDDNFGGEASAITTVGGTTDSDNLTAAQLPAHNNNFTIRGKAKFSNTADPVKGGNAWGDVTINVYSYDAGLTAYTLRDTITVETELVLAPDTETTVSWSTTVAAPDVDGDTGDRFRIEVSAFNAYGPSASDLDFSVWGENTAGYTTNGVAWQTLSTTTVSATDATAGATVRFLLMDADNVT